LKLEIDPLCSYYLPIAYTKPQYKPYTLVPAHLDLVSASDTFAAAGLLVVGATVGCVLVLLAVVGLVVVVTAVDGAVVDDAGREVVLTVDMVEGDEVVDVLVLRVVVVDAVVEVVKTGGYIQGSG
jgi:hypothetical protein